MERLPAARSYWSKKRNYIIFGWSNISLALKHLKGSCFSKLTIDAILKLWYHTEVPLFRQAKYDIEAPLLAYRNRHSRPIHNLALDDLPNLQGQGKQPFSLLF